MKKYFFLLPAFLVLFLTEGRAQTNTATTQAAQMKSGAQTEFAYNSATGGNIVTVTITNRLSTPLSLTPDQNKAMNTALYNFLNQKGSFAKLRLTDMTAYQQQLNALLQTLTGTTLPGFLSGTQVNQFIGLKPATNRTRDPLVMIFY